MRDFEGGGRPSGGTRVYVGGLDGEIKKEDLEFEFEKFGKLNNVWVAYNPPGFAFVEFADQRDAEAACDSLNNREIFGTQLRVEISRGRGRGRGRGGRGGGGRGFGGMRDEGRSGSFRGGGGRGRGSSGGRGRGGGGFRGGSSGRGGRGGFGSSERGFGGGDRSGDRFGNKDAGGGGGGRYQGNGFSGTREPRFRSRSPHRFSGGGGGGPGGGRREFGGGETFGRGGYQRNAYSGGGGY